MEKIFLTGATGFIGNNLVTKLLNKGFKVKILVRDKKKLLGFGWQDSVQVLYGDILEPETFANKISDCKIIIHSAALIAFWNKLWDKVYKVNVIGTRNILEEALKSGCKKFIHISSVAAIGYGESGEPINETHPYNWGKYNICYMETKYQAEIEVYNAIKKGLNATIVNPANVWGTRDIAGRRVPIIKVVKYGFPFYVNAGTNFVDVDAVCEGIINSIELGRCGERYILGGDNLTIKDFLGIIADNQKVRKPFIELPKFPVVLYSHLQEILASIFGITPRPTKSQLCFFGNKIYYNNTKAIKELKMPYISFQECLGKTINYYKEKRFL